MIDALRAMADAIVSDVVSTSTLNEIRAYCEQIIDDGDKELAEMAERRGLEEEDAIFYHLSYDPNEGPFSGGHADDCYDDGFYNGAKDGKYEMAGKILMILNKVERE